LSEINNEAELALYSGHDTWECGGGAAAALFEHQTHQGHTLP
jgi:hypothetical protein